MKNTIKSFYVKELVEKELMTGFASPVPFEGCVIHASTVEGTTSIVMNVFNPASKSQFELLVTIVVVCSPKLLSVEIRNKNVLLECDLWEEGNFMENVSKTIQKFVKRMKHA